MLLFFNIIYAQELIVTRDIGVWGGIVIKKEIFNHVKIDLEQQLRTSKNATRIYQCHSDVGLKYSIDKQFGLGANIRYFYKATPHSDPKVNLRYSLNINYKRKLLRRLHLYYRLTYQKTFINIRRHYAYNPQKISRSNVRNKIKLKVKYGKIHEFYFSCEIFRETTLFKEPYFDAIRLYIGDIVKSNFGKFNFALGIDREIQKKYPNLYLFAKIIYLYEL